MAKANLQMQNTLTKAKQKVSSMIQLLPDQLLNNQIIL